MSTPRIFVSHSHTDDALGHQLVADLQARLGEDAVWYDSSGGLHGGDEWWSRIVAEITARDTFIVIFSPDAVTSKWVLDEVNIAWSLRNRLGHRFIPIHARPCELRADWLLLQYASFEAPRPYGQLRWHRREHSTTRWGGPSRWASVAERQRRAQHRRVGGPPAGARPATESAEAPGALEMMLMRSQHLSVGLRSRTAS